MVDGEVSLDSRVSVRGYFAASISDGRLRLRSTRFVGLIPLNANIAVRVRPRASISNLSQMIVRSGCLPSVVEGFSRGYRPKFEYSDKAIEVYHESLLSSVDRLVDR